MARREDLNRIILICSTLAAAQAAFVACGSTNESRRPRGDESGGEGGELLDGGAPSSGGSSMNGGRAGQPNQGGLSGSAGAPEMHEGGTAGETAEGGEAGRATSAAGETAGGAAGASGSAGDASGGAAGAGVMRLAPIAARRESSGRRDRSHGREASARGVRSR